MNTSSSSLEARLGYRFGDAALLERALSHRSFCAEHPGHESNERLEFLGDAVLGMVVTDRIFADYPGLAEGELAKLRATVVSAETLASVADDLDLGNSVLLGRGEEQSGGRAKPSILADTVEALIGAVYLDGGLEAAATLVLSLFGDRMEEAAKGPGVHDHKTRLQELAVRVFDESPRYEVADEGPDHAKQFHATVMLQGAPRGRGDGTSKKQAEQVAAAEAWEWLRSQAGVPAELAEPAESAEPAEPAAPGEGEAPGEPAEVEGADA